MLRRHDTLASLTLSLLAALLVGLLLETGGLAIWAQRLGIGPLRDVALPLAEAWHGLVGAADRPRALALEWKQELALLLSPPPPKPVVVQEEVKAPSAPPTANEKRRRSESGRWMPKAAVSLPAPYWPASGERTVVLCGDSLMAVGLAPTLTRWLSMNPGARVVRAYKSGTGLARPEVFDWPREYPQLLGDTRPAYVICALGANDAQGVQVGKKVLAFGTAEWDAYYRQKLGAYLDLLARDGVPVLWVGLPTMRSPGYSQKMTHVNGVVKSVLSRYPNATWLDSNPSLGITEEGFQQFHADEKGRLIKIRSEDGIHLTDDGALFLVAPIARWMTQAGARRAAPPVQAVTSM